MIFFVDDAGERVLDVLVDGECRRRSIIRGRWIRRRCLVPGGCCSEGDGWRMCHLKGDKNGPKRPQLIFGFFYSLLFAL